MSNNRYWLNKLWKIHEIGQKEVIKNNSDYRGGSREGGVVIIKEEPNTGDLVECWW